MAGDSYGNKRQPASQQVLLKIRVCSAILESYRRERHCRVFDAGRRPRSPAQHKKNSVVMIQTEAGVMALH